MSLLMSPVVGSRQQSTDAVAISSPNRGRGRITLIADAPRVGELRINWTENAGQLILVTTRVGQPSHGRPATIIVDVAATPRLAAKVGPKGVTQGEVSSFDAHFPPPPS